MLIAIFVFSFLFESRNVIFYRKTNIIMEVDVKLFCKSRCDKILTLICFHLENIVRVNLSRGYSILDAASCRLSLLNIKSRDDR